MSELTPYPRAAAEREEAREPASPATGYASWGRRAGALIIDNLLLLIPAVGFFALIYASNDAVSASAAFLAIFFSIVFPFLYFTYFHGKTGQTLGKRWLGIRVEHGERGGPIGYGAAFGRYAMVFVFSIFSLPLILDYLFPIWDSRKQSLHDKVVGSVVVRA